MEREQVQILANAARMGDKNALSALYNEYCGKICFFAEAVLGKTEGIEEAVREIFAQVALNVTKAENGYDFAAWLYGIAYGVCEGRLAKRNPLCADEDEAHVSDKEPIISEFTPDKSIVPASLASVVRNLLITLPDEKRAALTVCAFCRFDLKTASAVIKTSAGTVKFRVDSASAEIGNGLTQFFAGLGQRLDSPVISVVRWALAYSFDSLDSTAQLERTRNIAELLKTKNDITFTVVTSKKSPDVKPMQSVDVRADQGQYSFIFCRKCGNRMDARSTFCNKCGTKLKKV